MGGKDDFTIPQEQAEQVKKSATSIANASFIVIVVATFGIIGVVLYWTQIKDRELPIEVDVDVEVGEAG